MKKALPFIAFTLLTFVSSCIINNPTPEGCIVETVKITEGSSFDIVFHDYGTDFYYINRGLERGLNLDSLNAKVLNKTVTLHLAKILGGAVTSEHISQLAIGDEIVWTEFD